VDKILLRRAHYGKPFGIKEKFNNSDIVFSVGCFGGAF
jgi:hypothetical protein